MDRRLHCTECVRSVAAAERAAKQEAEKPPKEEASELTLQRRAERQRRELEARERAVIAARTSPEAQARAKWLDRSDMGRRPTPTQMRSEEIADFLLARLGDTSEPASPVDRRVSPSPTSSVLVADALKEDRTLQRHKFVIEFVSYGERRVRTSRSEDVRRVKFKGWVFIDVTVRNPSAAFFRPEATVYCLADDGRFLAHSVAADRLPLPRPWMPTAYTLHAQISPESFQITTIPAESLRRIRSVIAAEASR